MSIDNKALPIWGWIAHHRESGGRPIIADPGRAAMLPSTEGWGVFPVCRVDDAADRLAELEEQLRLANIDALQTEAERAALEAENQRLRAALDVIANFETDSPHDVAMEALAAGGVE